MSTLFPPTRPAAERTPIPSGYCPFPITTDARTFGLATSSVAVGSGPVTVRHGRRTGGDTATILLHGAAGSWSTWTPLLRAADALATGDTPSGASLGDLIIPDLPGWGDTPLPSDEDALTTEAMAALVAELARALGYSRWVVIGHSMGGFIALELASAEVRATVSVGLVSATTFSVIESVRHPLARFTLLPGFTALRQVMRALGLAGRAGTAFVRGLERMSLLRPLVAPLFSRPGLISASVVAALGAEARPRAFGRASRRAGDYDPESAWSRIECPVRAQQGDTDVFVADSDAARLGRVIRDFTSCTLVDTGHFGHIERPEETLRLLPRRG
ncbi:Pimeloyl-ACP methyl ester carboxylesterase [Cryobacterium psychrotolerans]|uniref:Pimeloyl-ACP methyl ester carboxylesterase n=1 Tax=Cryobacterium psychrotolerans TaxID=386301 RepID=A0A1G9F0C2_9MICO|nr:MULTISPECIES: alpha/beta hydrolase [Cryobacterium]TFD42622.1 alpha/beta hydrolase [Cryobacterium sp. TMT1-2-1]TFD83288.1 alpha/beta hydrolase [Cryobacterium psychrotolerans]SDK81879.1 Pimeloyl-ACP methyl ester carboxylesterase [Cryobacterium psychrotolerans]